MAFDESAFDESMIGGDDSMTAFEGDFVYLLNKILGEIMGYSNYKNFKQTLEKLGLEETDENLFPQISLVQPSEWLEQSMRLAKQIPLTNEKSKSERIISPILTEIAVQFNKDFTMFSGEDLTVDSSKDLAGECDFFLPNTHARV